MEIIKVVESYQVSNRFIVAILQCGADRLMANTILEDTDTHKQWQVLKRLSHWASTTKLIDGEEIISVHTLIRPVEKINEFVENLKIQEANGIFEYTLNPIGHADKPPINAQLIVVK